MQRNLVSDSPTWWCKLCWLFLALCWCGGLGLGIASAAAVDESVISMMRLAPACQVSIVGLLAVILLPFLFTVVAVWFHMPWLILPIATLKAFSFGYCSFVTILSFGSAGWLVRFLLLFSDIATVPVLCWFWIRYISGNMRVRGLELAACAAIMLTIGCIDHCYVLPHLAALMA